MDASEKRALAITILGSVAAVLGSVQSSLNAGGFTVSAGVAAAIAGLVYYEAHETATPTVTPPPVKIP